jgi:hypothetical protein
MYPGDAASRLSTSQDNSLHLFLPSGTFHKQEEILNFSNNRVAMSQDGRLTNPLFIADGGRGRRHICFVSKASKPALGPTQIPCQAITARVFASGVKWQRLDQLSRYWTHGAYFDSPIRVNVTFCFWTVDTAAVMASLESFCATCFRVISQRTAVQFVSLMLFVAIYNEKQRMLQMLARHWWAVQSACLCYIFLGYQTTLAQLYKFLVTLPSQTFSSYCIKCFFLTLWRQYVLRILQPLSW